MPNKAIEFFKEKLQDIKDERRKTSIAKAVAFSKENKNCVIFLLDVKTDDMVACYQDKYMAARAVSRFLKRKTGLVKTILLGHGETKERDKNINIFAEFIKEFLWQISDKIGDPAENAKKQAEELKKVAGNNPNNQ